MENLQAMEERKRRLFDRCRDDIRKMISSAEAIKSSTPLAAERILERDRPSLISPGKKGTRSLVQCYTVENYAPGTSKDGFNRYLAKIVTEKFRRDAITELAALDRENPAISSVFAPLAGYIKKGEQYILVLELLNHCSLLEKYQNDTIIRTHDLMQAVVPCARLNSFKEGSPEVVMLEKKMEDLCEKHGEKEVFRIGRFATEDYVKFFNKFCCMKKGTPKKVQQAAEDAFGDLVKKYLTREDLMCLIQHDCQPWHHLGEKLIDAGNLKIGSPGVQLGRFLCYPSIFNKLFLFDPSNMNRLHNAEHCIKEITSYYSSMTSSDPQLIDNATYVGGIYGSIRLMPATDFTIQEKRTLKKSVLEQLLIMEKRENSAKALRAALERGWGVKL